MVLDVMDYYDELLDMVKAGESISSKRIEKLKLDVKGKAKFLKFIKNKGYIFNSEQERWERKLIRIGMPK